MERAPVPARTCPACGCPASTAVPAFLVCEACGLVFAEKVSVSVEAVYAAGMEELIYDKAKEGLFASALDLLERTLPARGRLLDVGCAGGALMRAAAERGWMAEGVELSPRLAAQASAAGFIVHSGPIEEAGLEAGAYDAVTVLEVFSQMEKPAAAAAGLHRLLKPGGVLYVREFNAAFHLPLYALEKRGFFKFLGASPSIVHNFNFTARSLRIMLGRAGFRDIRITNSPPTAGDPYRTGGRLGGLLTRALKVLYYNLARAVSLATFGRVLVGSTLIVTARK